MEKLDRIFYIYTGAWGSVFLMFAALVEVACGAAIGGDLQMYIANPAAGLFSIIALAIWLSILADERKYN